MYHFCWPEEVPVRLGVECISKRSPSPDEGWALRDADFMDIEPREATPHRLDGDNLKYRKGTRDRYDLEAIHDIVPFLSTNHRVPYPFATFVYLFK